MDLEEIENMFKDVLGECRVEMQAEDNKLMLLVIGDVFEGMSKVKRQQLVYGLLKDRIASGEIHAVSMKTMTRAEAEQQQPGNGGPPTGEEP